MSSAEHVPTPDDSADEVPEGFVRCDTIRKADYPHGLTLKLVSVRGAAKSTDREEHSGFIQQDIVRKKSVCLYAVANAGEGGFTLMSTSRVSDIFRDAATGRMYVRTGNRKSLYEIIADEPNEYSPVEPRTRRTRGMVAGVLGAGVVGVVSAGVISEYRESAQLRNNIENAIPIASEDAQREAEVFNRTSWLFDVDTSVQKQP